MITGTAEISDHFNGALLVGLMPVGTHESWRLGQLVDGAPGQVGAFGYFGGQSESSSRITPSDGWSNLAQAPNVNTELTSIDFNMVFTGESITFSTSIGDFSQELFFSDDFSEDAHFVITGWTQSEFDVGATVSGTVSAVPAPGPLALMAGALLLGGLVRRRRSS